MFYNKVENLFYYYLRKISNDIVVDNKLIDIGKKVIVGLIFKIVMISFLLERQIMFFLGRYCLQNIYQIGIIYLFLIFVLFGFVNIIREKYYYSNYNEICV